MDMLLSKEIPGLRFNHKSKKDLPHSMRSSETSGKDTVVLPWALMLLSSINRNYSDGVMLNSPSRKSKSWLERGSIAGASLGGVRTLSCSFLCPVCHDESNVLLDLSATKSGRMFSSCFEGESIAPMSFCKLRVENCAAGES